MVRHIAQPVAIQIVSAVVVPIVPEERRGRLAAVRRDVERVADEVVLRKASILRAREELHCPSVLHELVAISSKPSGTIHQQANRVRDEAIPAEIRLENLLEQ